MSKADEAAFNRQFPTARARDLADQAIDTLDVALPMSMYIDAWVKVAAGGKTRWAKGGPDETA